MRTSLYLVGLAAASIMGAGAVGFGCSSSSSPAAAQDSGTTEASVEDSSGGDGSGGGDAAEEPAVACTPSGVNVATMNFGSSTWSCFQAQCMPSLTMCAADCACDNGILSALQCAADAGAAGTMGCFVTAFGTLTGNTAGTAVETCLVQMMTPPSGACSGAPAGDGGTEGGDAAPVVDSGSAMDAADGGG
jgi:hypothetical protein